MTSPLGIDLHYLEWHLHIKVFSLEILWELCQPKENVNNVIFPGHLFVNVSLPFIIISMIDYQNLLPRKSERSCLANGKGKVIS